MPLITSQPLSQAQFIQELQDQYAVYSIALKTQVSSPHERRAQRSRLSQFLSFLAHSKRDYVTENPHRQAKDAAVSDYVDYLQYFLKARPTTITKALSTLGEFFQFIGYDTISIEREELPGVNPQALSNEQVEKFLAAAEANSSIKHRALALLLGTTGIRANECIALNMDDYIASSGTLCLRSTDTTSSPRAIALDTQTRIALEQWLQQRHQRFNRSNEQAMFLNPQRRRISQAGVNLIVRKISLEAGLDLNAQQLRDTHLLNSNQPASTTDDALTVNENQNNRAAI